MDTPRPMPAPGELELRVHVPAAGGDLGIDPGSGVVAVEMEDQRILVYFEGNRFGASNLRRYVDRVALAADRLIHRYPTVARRLCDPDLFDPVGWFHVRSGLLVLDDEDARIRVSSWAGEELDLAVRTSAAQDRDERLAALGGLPRGNPALSRFVPDR